MKFNVVLISLLSVAVLSGCTTVGEIRIDTDAPALENREAVTPQVERTVYVREVKDARVFDPTSKDPMTPNLKPSSPRVQSRMLGRILPGAPNWFNLEKGQTVQSVVKRAAQEAFVANGYRLVKGAQAADAKTLVVDIDVTDFWAGVDQGLVVVTLTGRMGATLHTGKVTLMPKAEQTLSGGFITANDWQKLFNDLYRSFYADLSAKIKTELHSN